MSEKRVQIKLIRSPIGRIPKHKATIRSLGLRKMNQTREHRLTPAVAGMIREVGFMLEVKELS